MCKKTAGPIAAQRKRCGKAGNCWTYGGVTDCNQDINCRKRTAKRNAQFRSMGQKMNMPVTQVRRMRLAFNLDDEEGENPWWNDEWDKEKEASLFWERIQDPEELWEWQTTGKLRGQTEEELEDSEQAEEQEA